MADNPESTGSGNLPPKLDLRKVAAAKPAVRPQTAGSMAAPVARPASTKLPTPSGTARPGLPSNLATFGANVTTPITITPAAAGPKVSAGPSPRPPTLTLTRPTGPFAPKAPGPTPTGRGIPTAEPQIQTVHIKIPKAEGTGGMVPPAKSEAPTIIAQEHAATRPPSEPNKKETSRIPLAAAKPSGGPTVMSTPSTEGPKTIRIKPKPATAQTQEVAQPGVLAAEDESLDNGSIALGEKRKTSRISLEAAISTEPTPDAGEAARPKTIRLKRPSEAATVKVSTQPSTDIPEPAHSSTEPMEGGPLQPAAARLEDTARLDMPPPDQQGDGGAPNRRRTIKVKRATQRPEVPMSLGGPAGGRYAVGDLAGARRAAQMVVKPDTMNATFPVFAIITMIVIMVTIYLFCTEAIGPNPCLTDYSYYKEGADLSWPGKISPFTR